MKIEEISRRARRHAPWRIGRRATKKTFRRGRSFLLHALFCQQAGFDIVRDSDGIYLASRKFKPGELRLLIDSVLSNRNICKTHTKEIIGKLTAEGGKYFKSYAKHVTNLVDWQKDEN